jgi:hypothetical protein
MIIQCTAGGILVPIFINSIPFPLSHDAYPVAITVSFLLHQYCPMVREIVKLSEIFEISMIGLYELYRAYVVVKLTAAAGGSIAPSEFSFAIFGPIFCGTIAGCGYSFLPLNKGLDPIKDTGLGENMISAFLGATFYHIFLNTTLSKGVMNASKKAHAVVAIFFIFYHLYVTFRSKHSKEHQESKKTR